MLALSVSVGLGVVHSLMEREVDEVVGPKQQNPNRTAKRHGHERGSMTLGGRRVPVSRPRMRTADDERELPVTSYEYFADRDPLTRAVMDRMLAGVSTRKYQVVGEPVGEELVDRGLDPDQGILFVIDGGRALRKAIKDVFGEHALVHRCHRHKERNITDLLPERDRPQILVRIRGAWSLTDHHLARERLELLASELERTRPDAAASLREGMEDTLTLMRLGIDGQLAKSLCSTNPRESMIEIVRYTQRNVKRWRDGDMRKRWTAAGMLVAEQQFRRIIAYRDLAKLVIAIERHTLLVANDNHDQQETREIVTV